MDKIYIVSLIVGFISYVVNLFTLLKEPGAPFDLRSGLVFFGLPILAGALQGGFCYISLQVIKWAIL